MNAQIQEAQGILCKKEKNEEKWIKVYHDHLKASGKQKSLRVPERKDTFYSKGKKTQDTINKIKKTNYGLWENTCKINW